MSWFGLGKPRSRFGKWLDERGIKQQELARESGVSEDTITRLANEEDRKPSWKTEKRLLKTLRRYESEVRAEDFWEEGND